MIAKTGGNDDRLVAAVVDDEFVALVVSRFDVNPRTNKTPLLVTLTF
jgi:hypothetical protein